MTAKPRHEWEKDRSRQVVRDVYDHLCRVRDDDMALYGQYVQKIQKLLTVQIVLFASLSFGLTQLTWVKDSPAKGFHVFALGLLAVLGGACLLIAFLSCVTCLGIERTPTVGVRLLEELVKEGDIYDFTPEMLVRDLCQNFAAAIVQERDIAEKRKRRAWSINWSTRAGVVFLAVFLVYAIIGNTCSTLDIGATTVTDEPNNDTNEKPAVDSSQGTDKDAPSAVEPTETSVHSHRPPNIRPSAVEPPESRASSPIRER